MFSVSMSEAVTPYLLGHVKGKSLWGIVTGMIRDRLCVSLTPKDKGVTLSDMLIHDGYSENRDDEKHQQVT